jgi:hypothetical protein
MTGAEVTSPHRWPACPWPGWAQLYAQLIRDLRTMDPDLVVEDVFDGAVLSIGTVTASAGMGDRVFDRINEAERLAEISCVVCGTSDAEAGQAWPPLCGEHSGGTTKEKR